MRIAPQSKHKIRLEARPPGDTSVIWQNSTLAQLRLVEGGGKEKSQLGSQDVHEDGKGGGYRQ